MRQRSDGLNLKGKKGRFHKKTCRGGKGGYKCRDKDEGDHWHAKKVQMIFTGVEKRPHHLKSPSPEHIISLVNEKGELAAGWNLGGLGKSMITQQYLVV